MVVMYEIAGRKIGSHYLAIGTLATMFTGAWAMSGGSKKPTQQGPPINAGSKDEENFITDFMKSAEGEKAQGKH